jgi:hypothetical protein
LPLDGAFRILMKINRNYDVRIDNTKNRNSVRRVYLLAHLLRTSEIRFQVIAGTPATSILKFCVVLQERSMTALRKA